MNTINDKTSSFQVEASITYPPEKIINFFNSSIIM